ncbi:MAG TPA: multicopper oxidase domain-containing protein [Acidobacteriaceae bacterium]|nr:multicopper oxidase domain-containing protein [Acidobacteriaceae bacterium]
MNRRDLLKLAPAALAAEALARSAAFAAPAQITMLPGMGSGPSNQPAEHAASSAIDLRIAPVTVELAPDRILSTIGYNGTSPGPVLRMKEGRPTTVTVHNETDTPEYVHWHGFLIPSSVDGSEEEETPPVPPHGSRTYSFTPTPSGSRWYHSHAMAMGDLHKGTFTGQFGFVYIEPAQNPGAYDQELFLALRDWDPFYTTQMVDMDEVDDPDAPKPEKPAVLNTAPNGLEVTSTTYSINDKALGAGEPIRVRQGQRVLFHFLNASAIENRRVSLGGHKFQVIALDGNPVPTPAPVETLFLGAGERVCAIVEMNNPGVWILGEPTDLVRSAGLGVLVEYANSHQQPQWIKPATLLWDYTRFAKPAAGPAAADPSIQNIDMAFEKVPGGSGKFNTFTVNGKPYPHENEFVLHQGQRYRLTMRNRTDDAHPLHMHRHQWELIDLNTKPTAGLIKDTVVVPIYGRATVEFTANQPGLTLFHCHIQQHMDFGFKALFRYA